jgi:hypothetical protein
MTNIEIDTQIYPDTGKTLLNGRNNAGLSGAGRTV